MNRVIGKCFLFLVFGVSAIGQNQEFNHPELHWRTSETEHFYVHFHQGEDRTASLVTTIAEAIYQPVTQLYGYVPDGKIHFIVRDHEDDSNGAAFYYDNKVEIWASAMDFSLRGTHHWLKNVITHEFVHMISLGAARKMSRQLMAVYLQWIGYEKEKRTDVIHGYPNIIASIPIVGTVIPMWFAEGMTQTQISGWNYDTWDSHRDMVLRIAAVEGKLLSLNEMGFFGKNSIGNERVYNQGYGLVLFIVERYGIKALSELVRNMKPPLRFDFSGAVKNVLHKTEKELYDEWILWIIKDYEDGIKPIEKNRSEGIIVESSGSGNYHPMYSPNHQHMAYISNRNRDYISQTALWIRKFPNFNSPQLLVPDVSGSFSWSPDGKKIAYARKVRNGTGSHFFDLFVYDLEKKKETRLTRSLRIREPDWSSDGKTLVCVKERDGTSNLVLFRMVDKTVHQITAFQNGEQIFNPRWFGETGKIVFAFSEKGEGRDIAEVNSDGTGFHYLIQTASDERDPYPADDGKMLYYSSDRTGIYNIYRRNLNADSSVQLTNVIGGAFMPSCSKDGRVVFSLFQAEGYKIAKLDSIHPVLHMDAGYVSPYTSILENLNRMSLEKPAINDRIVEPVSARSYKPIFSKLTFLPRMMVDFPNKVKIGTYVSGSDFLDRISIFGGFAANGQWDTDAFGIFQYRIFYPTLFTEVYQLSRHTSDEEYDYKFNLLETDIGADWPLTDNLSLRSAWQFSRNDVAQYFSVEGQRIKIPYTYHIGNVFSLHWTYQNIIPSLLSGIAPRRGRSAVLRIDRASQRFMEGFAISQNYGTLIEVYRKYNYFQYFLDWTEYMPALRRDHGIALRLQVGYIDRPVDSFYHFFAGGLDGLKGYPYYSLGGTRMTQLGLSYRFPIAKKIGARLLWLNIDNLFLAVYGQGGCVWERHNIKFSDWKRDAGLQLRLGFYSFYGFPMALSMDAAYGFDRFNKNGNTYGHEWRYYFGLLFDFLD